MDRKIIPRSQIMEISVLVNSSIFAILICFVSLSVIQEFRSSVMYDQHPIIRHSMCFGMAYFFYDIIAMFFSFQQKYNETNTIHKKCVSLGYTHYDCLRISYRSPQCIRDFVKSKSLILVHHVLIPLLGIAVSSNENFKTGDFLFAIGFLMEASTPFVCCRRILEILGHTNDSIHN